jgi:hypothetical protein
MARRKNVNISENIRSLLEAEMPKRKKVRKPRKPMTAEQKAAAAERLKKARAKKKPAVGKTYHRVCYDPKLQFKPLQTILEWSKEAKEQAYSARKDMNRLKEGSKDWTHASNRHLYWYGYANDINWYLRHGDWISNTYGFQQQNKTKWKTVVHAYYPDGTVKGAGPPPIITDNVKPKRRKRKKRNEAI